MPESLEKEKLSQANARTENWQRWGTYLPERQWGTVREDYSTDGNSWSYLTYEKSRYQAYRWGEDGLLGWTDRECRLCFSTSLWNGQDEHLKERLFGVSNPEGNHGEDVKELYYYLDAVPSGSYAHALYKYPQRQFPYADLLKTNAERGFTDSEYELLDTGVFDEERYFDMHVEYCKQGVDDILIRLTVINRGPEVAPIWLMPTLTFQNDWAWGNGSANVEAKPYLERIESSQATLGVHHKTLGAFTVCVLGEGKNQSEVEVLLTENDTNEARLNGQPSVEGVFTKDAFDRYLVGGERLSVRTCGKGTKAAFLFRQSLAPGAKSTVYLRLASADVDTCQSMSEVKAEQCFERCKLDADAFYDACLPKHLTPDEKNIARQAYAGLLWSKQFYHYVADDWLEGNMAVTSPILRPFKRNVGWQHLFCHDVLSMPDKWEYPWFAAWDSAFHMVSMVEIDPDFAKRQLLLLLREWYMHPNGQMASFEYAFSDVNPPVHAWAALEVYKSDAVQHGGVKDTDFLERCFQKLLLNFTWWVNREDAEGRNLFAGGFLGLDNIGVFDRSQLKAGTQLQQADGTAWMGFYCLSMLNIALELAQERTVYEDIASKFLEHYVQIVEALNHADGTGLWDDEVGFYFDRMSLPDGWRSSIKIRSIVGLIPLFGVTVLTRERLSRLTSFRERLDWFLTHRSSLARHISAAENPDPLCEGSLMLSLVPKDRLQPLLSHIFDPEEFLSEFGIRSMSRFHDAQPYMLDMNGEQHQVRYLSAESDSGLFGGNSNWRGPIWMPINRLLIDALQQYETAFGSQLHLEYPTGSGKSSSFGDIAHDLNQRMLALFRRDAGGRRPLHGEEPRYKAGGAWESLLLFPEYFCGDTGRGAGASHQTGWTSLIAGAISSLPPEKESSI
jgi:hypothetical protein